jgi:uncharacterized protein DUF1206
VTTTVASARREFAPWIERLARLGYVAIGTVYIIVGLLSAALAVGVGGKPADPRDAYALVYRQPFGRALLFAIAAGLLGYAAWRISSAIEDTDLRGNDAKGIAIRMGACASALLHAAIAIRVIVLATHHGHGSAGSDASAKHWTARFLEQPFGRWIVAIAGLCIIGSAVYDLYKVWRSDINDRLRLGGVTPQTRRAIVAICRFGIAARAIVFAIIGGSIVRAAMRLAPGEARGTSGAFVTLYSAPMGRLILACIAIGFAAYGIYKFIEARYRIVRAA